MIRYLIKATLKKKRNCSSVWRSPELLYFHDNYNWHTYPDGALVYDKRQADEVQKGRQEVEDMFPQSHYRVEAEEVLR